jgi:DMSO/TMAO reductase YedYZ molybdopterin-dependent catalytic subunit
MSRFHRRDFLSSVSRAALLAAGSGVFRGAAWALPEKLGVPQGRSAEKIRGFPFADLDSFLTPTDQFFLRSHLEIPTIRPDQYRLQIGGFVERPYSLGLGDLERMSRSSYPATFECSGSAVGGGMVSTAEWSGVELWKLLERAKPKAGALEVVMEGSDAGLDELVPVPVQFARSVPIPTLRSIPGLLVVAMNGAALRPEHGYPVRALPPGLYGVQNEMARPPDGGEPALPGLYQTQRYVGLRQTPQGVHMEGDPPPAGEIADRASVPRPEAQGRLPGEGAPWSGAVDRPGGGKPDGGRQQRKAISPPPRTSIPVPGPWTSPPPSRKLRNRGSRDRRCRAGATAGEGPRS